MTREAGRRNILVVLSGKEAWLVPACVGRAF